MQTARGTWDRWGRRRQLVPVGGRQQRPLGQSTRQVQRVATVKRIDLIEIIFYNNEDNT